MIGFARDEHLPALERLWALCFGDSPAYTQHLFENLLRPDRILAVTEDGIPRAMLCLQDFFLSAPGGQADACYIFGVATHPDFRGRGFSSALLEEAHRRLAGRGAALSALVPASKELFGFYGARGYQTAFSVCQAEYRAEDLEQGLPEPPGLSPISFPAMKPLRDRFYADRPFACWDADYLRFLDGECRLLGGDVLFFSLEGRPGYAVCCPAGDTVVVRELLFPPALTGGAVAAIHAFYSARRYLVRLPADFPASETGEVLPFAMVRWYDREKEELLDSSSGQAPFLTHVLD